MPEDLASVPLTALAPTAFRAPVPEDLDQFYQRALRRLFYSAGTLRCTLYSWTCGTHITSSTSPPFLSFFTEVSSYLRHDCGRCLRTAGSIGASTDGQRRSRQPGRRGDCRDVHARPFFSPNPRLEPSVERTAWSVAARAPAAGAGRFFDRVLVSRRTAPGTPDRML